MPIKVDSNADTLWLFVVAALVGAFGGLLADLAKERRRGGSWSEITATFGSMVRGILLGTGAAVAVLAVFRPLTERTTTNAETIREWDPFRLVGLALIAGYAGRHLLAAAEERLLGLLTKERLESALDVAKEGNKQLIDRAKDDVMTTVKQSVESTVRPLIERAAGETPAAVIDQLRKHDAIAGQTLTIGDKVDITQARPIEELNQEVKRVAENLAEQAASSLEARLTAKVDSIEQMIQAAGPSA